MNNPTLAQRHSTLAALLPKMNVPSYKTDTNKVQNVQWLIGNLHVRNKSHPSFDEAMGELLFVAEHTNALKTKEIRRIREELGFHAHPSTVN